MQSTSNFKHFEKKGHWLFFLMKISKTERKIEEMFLVFQIIAFDIVPADSKYNKDNTCDRQLMFQ